MASEDEIIVKLTADASALNAGLDEAAVSVQAAQESMRGAASAAASATDASTAQMGAAWDALTANINAAADSAKASLDKMAADALAPISLLGGIADGTATTMDALAAQEDALDTALSAGTISAEDYARALGQLDAQTDALGMSMDAAADAQERLLEAQTAAMSGATAAGAAEDADTAEVDANTAATDANTEAVRVNGRARERGYMPMGIYGAGMRAMEFATTPLGMGVTAVAAVGAAALLGAHDQAKFNDALIATGHAAEVSDTSLNAMAATMQSQTVSFFDAKDALEAVAHSAQSVGVPMHLAAQTVADVMALTGEKAQQATAQFEALGTGGARAIAKLDTEFKFLTPEEAQQIINLERIGDTTKAATLAATAFASTMQSRMGEATASLTPLEGALKDVKDVLEDTLRDMESLGSKIGSQIYAGPQARLAQLQSRIDEDVKEGTIKRFPDGAYQVTGKAPSTPGALGPIENAWNAFTTHTTGETPMETLAKFSELTGLINATKARDDAYAKTQEAAGASAASTLNDFVHPHHAHAGALGAYHVPPLTFADVGAKWTDDQARGNASGAMHLLATQAPDVMAMVNGKEQQASAAAALQRTQDATLVALGEETNAEMLAHARSNAEAIFQTKAEYLAQELDAYSNNADQVAAIKNQIYANDMAFAQQRADIDQRGAQQDIASWESTLSPIAATISQTTQGIVEGTETATQARLRLEQSLVAEVFNYEAQSLEHHLAIELAKTQANMVGEESRLALTVAGEARAALVHAESALKWIETEAAKAAAGAWNALVSIPYVGPILAPAAALATMAGVMALASKVASAEGGWERVPMDGMPTILHKDEQVLPASYAEGLRNLVANGAGGGVTNHYEIHAIDGASFEDYIRRHGGDLEHAVRGLGRMGFGAA